MSKFNGEKLKSLRKEFKLSHQKLATKLGLKSKGSMANMEKGLSLPGVQVLIKIIDFFGVSADWLLDRENIWMEDICKLNTLLGQICKFNRDVLQHSNNEASINCVEHINDCFHNIGEFGYELKNMAIKGSCDKEKINYGTENLETFFKIIYDENFTRFLPLDSKTLLFFIEKYDYYLWFREFKERIMMQYE